MPIFEYDVWRPELKLIGCGLRPILLVLVLGSPLLAYDDILSI